MNNAVSKSNSRIPGKILLWSLIVLAILFLSVKFIQSDKKTAKYFLPKLKIATVQILDLNSERAVATMDLRLYNPLIGLHIDSLFYTVSIENKEVIRSTYPSPFDLPADSSHHLVLPVTIYYDKLVDLLKTLEKKGLDSVTYKVKTIAYTNYLLKKKIVIETERYLPLIRIPEISIEGVHINKPGISNTVVNVSILLYNPNVFSVGFKDMHYAIKIDDDKSLEGNMPDPVWASAMDTTRFSIQSSIDLKEVADNIVDYLINPAKSYYKLTVSMKLLSKQPMIENSKMILISEGTLKEIKKIRKDIKEEKKEELKQEKKKVS